MEGACHYLDDGVAGQGHLLTRDGNDDNYLVDVHHHFAYYCSVKGIDARSFFRRKFNALNCYNNAAEKLCCSSMLDDHRRGKVWTIDHCLWLNREAILLNGNERYPPTYKFIVKVCTLNCNVQHLTYLQRANNTMN